MEEALAEPTRNPEGSLPFPLYETLYSTQETSCKGKSMEPVLCHKKPFFNSLMGHGKALQIRMWDH